MRVDKSVIVLFRQMNLFLNRELLDEKLTSSDVLYLALLYEQDGRTQDEMAEAYTVDRAATTRRSAPQLAFPTTCILSRPLARPTIPKQK